MKKIILTLTILILTVNSAQAQTINADYFKNLFSKEQAKKVTPSPLTADGEMTKSEEATLYYSENDLKNAFSKFLAIKENERTAQDWLLIGNILQDQGKNSDAVFMYNRAIMLDSKFYKAYYNLANIYLEDEKYNLAIENYRLANKANNKFPFAYYNLGCAYLKTGNLKKAKIAFLKAIELKNTEASFHYNLAYTYKMLGNEKLSKQYLGFYNKLMENNP